MEKEIWKWVLDCFPDEGIANLADEFGINIKGFRNVNPQQPKFKIVRPRIIQIALQKKNAQKLVDFFNSRSEETEFESFRGESVENLIRCAEENIHPSILFGILLSSEDKEDHITAEEVYKRLKEEDKLDILEKQADEMAIQEENENPHDDESFNKLQEELKAAHQIINKLEKRMKKFEQKNEELKSNEIKAQAALKNEKKRVKDEKTALNKDMNALKGEIGKLKHQVKSLTSNNDSLQKNQDKQAASIKTKDEEISRLNALVLKLETDLDKLSNIKEKEAEAPSSTTGSSGKLKVTLIGDPKNSRIQNYPKYELTIVTGPELQDQETHIQLEESDQIWLLNYKIPRSIQKRTKTLVKEKQIKEFATFIELENYMLKGLV